MSVLESVNCSNDIKKLNNDERLNLCDELRDKIIKTIDKNGGHLASNLGIVETIVALCYTFDFPKDKLLFDVGHQCYAYKILTGRRDGFDTIRQNGGISGFPDREESCFDSFIAGHAGNSLGASLGKCLARDSLNDDYFVIDIVGDGAFVNGLNMEALTSNRIKPCKHIVILNDNGMSISKNKNGFYQFISEKSISNKYVKGKEKIQRIFGESFITKALRKIKNLIKRLLRFYNIFENFGYKYVGIFDGNDLDKMIKILSKVKVYAENEAVLLHIHTKKGKGLFLAEDNAQDYHGVGAHLKISKSSFSNTVGNTLNEIINKNKKVFAITAGMASGTGLAFVEKENPNNFIDVGIAEEYAVNLASGMASEGLKPVVCIYSTFLQRAYDELLHDVCIQKLPVVFCVDRAGLVGNDGKTHQGVFDISFASHLPNLKIYAPKNNAELKEMIYSAIDDNGPIMIRYPSDSDLIKSDSAIFNGKWEIVERGNNVAILAVGPRMNKLALIVNEKLQNKATIINARVIKPLDSELIDSLNVNTIITLEENMLNGGFGNLVERYVNNSKKTIRVISYGIKDEFISHASVVEQLNHCGITVDSVVQCIENL